MQTAAVNQLITDQLTKFQFYGDNRLEFLSGFPEVAAHFGFTELIYGEPPLARPDFPAVGVEVALHEDVYKNCLEGEQAYSSGILQPTFWASP